MIVFALIALGWWLAAPDKFTAAARTASGTGLKAAGTGAKVHWNAGRDGRKLGRNDRRDRWHKRGGWWRKLLGLEHGAVVTGKAVKGMGKLAAAAVKPVPDAIRDGWRAGQARHGARTAGRPVPVALDPPWWHPKPALEQEPGQVEDTPQDSGEDSPEQVAETGQDGQAGQDRGALDVGPNPPQRTPYNPGYTKDGLTIDDEDEIRARHPVLAQIQPEPLTEAQRRFWTLRDRGYPGPINQDGWPVPEPGALGGFIRDPVPYLQREPIDPPAGTDPDGSPTPSTDNPGGTVSPTPFGAELDDLTSVQDFAVKVADMAEESDFAQLVEFCKHASDETRDFGADMAGNVAEFEEIAAKIGDLLSELVDAAQHVRDRSAELIGG